MLGAAAHYSAAERILVTRSESQAWPHPWTLSEPTTFAWNHKTVSMPHEQWKPYTEKHSFLTCGGEAMASVEVSVRPDVRG